MKLVLTYPSGNHITIGSCKSRTSYTPHKSSTASNANHISINKYDYSIQIPFSSVPKMEILAPILISPLLGSPGFSPHLRDLFNISRQACQQGYPSQRVYELIVEISPKFSFFLLWYQWSDQVTYLHMSRQLSCRDMCKIVTWMCQYYSVKATWIFTSFGIWGHKLFVKSVPGFGCLREVLVLCACQSVSFMRWWGRDRNEELSQWRRNNMAAVLQTTFSTAFFWLTMAVFWLKFHWNLFP